MKKIYALLVITVFAAGLKCYAQTTISGPTVSGHWTTTGSPYIITGSVYIPYDSALQIDPGVTVSFKSQYQLTMLVEGQLLAVGTQKDTITFISSDSSTGFGGIKFDDSSRYRTISKDTSRLVYCKIQYGMAKGPSYVAGNGGALLFVQWSKAIVSHCLISNCSSNPGSFSGGQVGAGGAIFCDSSSSPIITYNTITHNSVNDGFYGNGGGIYCNNSSNPTISYNTISYNSAIYRGNGGGAGLGGGLYCNSSNPIIFNNTIVYNFAHSNYGGYGGGIYSSSGNPVISYNTISHNIGTDSSGDGAKGGGIYCYGSSGLIISHNNISYNSVDEGIGSGGAGIYCDGGTVVSSMDNNIVSYNSVSSYFGTYAGGGGIACNGCTISSLSYNVISNNSADSAGGGLYCINSAIIDTISNTSITNNSVRVSKGGGGGFYCSGASPVMINVTIANNNAFKGGGMYCDATAKPNLYNCILWGNTAASSSDGNQLYQNDANSIPSFYYSDVQGGKTAFGLGPNFYTGTYANDINSDPKFVSPSTGAGSTYDGSASNWNISTGSPCIDAGDPLSPYLTYPSTDLAGKPRIVICRIDIGSYENQYGTSSPLKVKISGDTSICIHDSTTLTASGATTYTWSPSTGLSSNNKTNPVEKPDVTTTYTVVGTSGICEGKDTIRITVKPLPTVSISGTDSTCFGTPIMITAGGGSTYLWNNSDTSSVIIVTPVSTATYTVTVTKNGCSKDTIFKLTVHPLPAAKTGAPRSICNGDTTTIGAPAITGDTYSWSSLPTGFNSFASNALVNPDNSTIYYLTETITTTGCTKTDSTIITVNPLPIAQTGSAQSICDLGSATIGSSAISGDTYSWSSNPKGFNSIASNPSVNPNLTTVYYLTETITNTGCSKTDSVIITVFPLPDAGFSIINLTGRNYNFQANDKTLASYDWTFGDSKTGAGDTISHIYNADGSYTVSLKVKSSEGCSSFFDSTFTVSNTGIKTSFADYLNMNVYPNPFQTSTIIGYSLNKTSNINIAIFDVTGKLIAVIANKNQVSGNYQLNINAEKYHLLPGIYMLKFMTDDGCVSRNIVKF